MDASKIRQNMSWLTRHLTWKRAGYVVVLLVEEVVLGVIWKGLRLFGDLLHTFGEMPMREGGALLVVALVVGILWAAIDPVRLYRERKDRMLKEKTAVPLTPEEKELIQPIRTLWELNGRYAVGTLLDIYELIASRAHKNLYWSPLLRFSSDALRERIEAVQGALAHDSTIGITEVRERFNQMLEAYYGAARWIAQTAGHKDADLEEEHVASLHRSWKHYHYLFIQELLKLETIPGHPQTLKYRLMLFSEDGYLRAFLAEAENPPQSMLGGVSSAAIGTVTPPLSPAPLSALSSEGPTPPESGS